MIMILPLSIAHAINDKDGGMQEILLDKTCQNPPPGPRDMEADPFYIDHQSSQLDQRIAKNNALKTQVFREHLEHVISDADRYVLESSRPSGLCALKWIQAWAVDGAMLGNMVGYRDGVEAANNRRAFATGFGIAYLKIRDLADAQENKDISSWLLQLERKNRHFMKLKKQRNNLYYWGGVESLTAGLAAHDQDAIDFARTVYHQAIDDILDNGSQSMEMRRGQMSLIYSNAALGFILIMAHLSRCAGEDWSLYRSKRLALLVNRVYEGISDPRWYADQANSVQKNPKPYNLGWILIYPHGNLMKDTSIHQKNNIAGEYRLGGNWAALEKVCPQ